MPVRVFKTKRVTAKYQSLINAYSDCNELGKGERNLDYHSRLLFTADELHEVMPLAITDGYNDFDSVQTIAKVITAFPESQFRLCREESVCIHVHFSYQGNKGKRFWLSRSLERNGVNIASLADEVSVEHSSLGFYVRLWWD
jgi:hypothetical protein